MILARKSHSVQSHNYQENESAKNATQFAEKTGYSDIAGYLC